jgi:hypothetical protein
MNAAAAAAAIFRAADADDAQLRRYPVEHLADILTGIVEHTAAGWAAFGRNIFNDISARQMVR